MSLSTTTSHVSTLVVPFGLSSAAGSRLNGRIGELRVVHDNGRGAISFDPRHAPSQWKLIALERLRVFPQVRTLALDFLNSPSSQELQVKAGRCTLLIGECLRVHERIFLACTSNFFYDQIARSTREEISMNTPKEFLNDQEPEGSEGEYPRDDWPDHEHIPQQVDDIFLLYQVAVTLMRPLCAEKVVSVQQMSTTMKADVHKFHPRAPITRGEIDYATYFKQQLLKHGVDFDRFQNEWYPTAINGNPCDYAGQILNFVYGNAPFTVTLSRRRNLDRLLIERQMPYCGYESDRSGPMMVTPMHVAARIGDASLCQLLVRHGASVNQNIFIPNHFLSKYYRWNFEMQISKIRRLIEHLLPEAAHCRRGIPNTFADAQPNVYHWGVVTPMRLAVTFGHVRTVAFLRNHHGRIATAEYSKKIRDYWDEEQCVFKSYPRLLKDACWTSKKENKIFCLYTEKFDDPFFRTLNCNVLYTGGDILALDEPVTPIPAVTPAQVIQEVCHEDAPIPPDSAEEAALVSEMWTTNVEEHIRSGNVQPVPETNPMGESWIEVSPPDMIPCGSLTPRPGQATSVPTSTF